MFRLLKKPSRYVRVPKGKHKPLITTELFISCYCLKHVSVFINVIKSKLKIYLRKDNFKKPSECYFSDSQDFDFTKLGVVSAETR